MDLNAEINKRLTLNLLIQGAAAHTFVTASHLVQDELEQIRPGLTRLYDRFAISGQLNYCIGDNVLVFGRPNRWLGFSKRPQAAMSNHLLMSTHGNRLATEETRHLKQLGRPKGVIGIPFFHWVQFMWLIVRVMSVEREHTEALAHLAKRVTSQIWGIPIEQLDGEITTQVAFGNLQPATTFRARVVRQGAAGYGGVERRGDGFVVKARAWVFPLLVHELVKGTMELICLHGMGDLSDETYRAVTDAADRVEYEAWLLQAGPALWRRLIAITPRDRSLPQTIMTLAKLDPYDLEELMMHVIEQPNVAQATLDNLLSTV